MESWAEKYRPESLSDLIGNTTVINDTKAEQVIPISSGDTRVETSQKRGSRGTDIVIQTYDVDNEWILATMSAYDITGYVGAII